MQYIPAACSTSEWPAGGVNPKPPKTSLQAVVDAESRPSIPRWGKRSPPVAVAAFVPPTPAATSGSLSSLISCPCGTLLAAVPRITWHFYFAFCPAIFLPLTELRIGPPESCHPIPSLSPPAASHPMPLESRGGGRRSIPVLRRRLVLSDASPSGWRRPALSSEGFNRGPLPCQCRDEAVSHPPPPPPSLIRTPVVGRRLPMVCVCVCVCCCVATMHLFPIPHPVHPLPSSGTISRICSLFSPGLGASRGIVSLPPLLARQNHSGQTLYMIPRLSLHYPHLRLIGTA